MRPSRRLLATVSKYLEPGAPTGLTGLKTHPSPRSALLYAYAATLEKLKALPEHSVYRKSTEALTARRLAIVESFVPAGYEEWRQRAAQYIQENKETFDKFGLGETIKANGTSFLSVREPATVPEGEEFSDKDDGPDTDEAVTAAGESSSGTGSDLVAEYYDFIENDPEELDKIRLPSEPQLTREQIGEIEDKIGGGLIEEVILTAKNELGLLESMLDHQVWEDLVETPQEGQWTYHARATHMPKTQQP